MRANNAFLFGIVSLVFQISKHVDGEVFTSVVDLENILYAEQDLSNVIDNYIQSELLRLDKLQEIANDYRKHSQNILAEPEKKLGNLVSAFRTVKRFTVDWNNIFQSYIQANNESHGYIAQMQTIAQSFPCNDDLKTAAANVLRIQDTYALEPAAMARGNVNGMVPGEELNSEDCFELGRLAYDQEDYYHAILWMEHALILNKDEKESKLVKSTLYDYLNFAHYQRRNIYRASEIVEEWLLLEPNAARALNNMKHYDMMKANKEAVDAPDVEGNESKPDLHRPRNDWQQQQTFDNYERLCRGEVIEMVGARRHQLFCSFKSYHSMFTIMPLQEEILNFEPLIRVYHNVLSDKAMARVRELATPHLHRSGVFQTNDKPNPFTQYRISKTAWINDREDPIIKRVSLTTSAITNLTLETVEELQVVNYGIGGHYEPHHDYSKHGEATSFTEGHGNRLATIICYLEHVDAGGGTVFPDLGIAVKPEKGSCAVWFNLRFSGEGDERTIHAGCPVLTGSKWIATKWFHETGNEFTRKCDTDPLL